MRLSRAILPLLALAAWSPVPAAPPSAGAVVVRGKRKLDDALAAALRPILKERGEVALVVDVTPYTADEQQSLAEALQRLEPLFPQARSWRIGRLGARLSDPVRGPSELAYRFGRVFQSPTKAPSTLRALARTLGDFGSPSAAIVYLADWHFEDDERLEEFIAVLRRRRQGLSVVGSEAAFERGWNDGFFPPHRGQRDEDGRSRMYDEQIGRDPFGSTAPDAPWHGGETAFPHLPGHFSAIHWSTEFPAEIKSVRTWEDHLRRRYAKMRGDGKTGQGPFEDARERLGPEAVDRQALQRYSFPLPSSFGPYGLMRAAAVTGGRYVLWSFNPEGRTSVPYSYVRCDLFAPDLRSRHEILADVRRRPLVRAIVEAWHGVANEKLRIAAVTPPLARHGLAPLEMVEARGHSLSHSWSEPGDHARFGKVGERMIEALDRAILVLDRALAKGSKDPRDRRYLADAELFRHTLRVHRFSTAEALAAARELPRNAWKDDELTPGIDPVTFIRRETVEGALETELVELHDREAASELLAERRRFLERFRGTPFAELVRRNGVMTYKLDWHRVGTGVTARRSPAASDGEPGPKTRPGGGSSGQGPTTGRG